MTSPPPETAAKPDIDKEFTASADTSKPPSEGSRPSTAVRFAASVEEIEPAEIPSGPLGKGPDIVHPDDATPEKLSELSKSLEGSHLQNRRMNIFAFEPFSLPASRVPSHEDSAGEASRQHTRSSGGGSNSPQLAPKGHGVHTPPLTPAGSGQTDHESKQPKEHSENEPRSSRHGAITPQESGQEGHFVPAIRSSQRLPIRAQSSEEVPRRLGSLDGKDHLPEHRRSMFQVGPPSSGGSAPASRETSPSRSRPASLYYTRPSTPQGEINDPYAASKRQPQNKDKIESRFVFRRRQGSPSRSSKSSVSEKRSSGIFGGHHSKKDAFYQHDDSSAATIHGEKGSMSDLKRFLKIGGHHKAKGTVSPSGNRTPVCCKSATPSVKSSKHQMPFDHQHGLESKYGNWGRILGAGAGGSVRIMRRAEDNTVFAVKEFRARHSYETEKEYVKKLTAEYCMGSSLHHGNIIETLDIVQEKHHWYEVMEYAPYDLFAIVMTGRMTRAEISCCFLQILNGVTYLHSMGLAHRDLKLDNVVVSDKGIMKIIDFGSAHVYKYPFESEIIRSSGIVGSDPYLAPEVYEEKKYDPRGVDIWSLAIIFCCMTLRRFPWKVPRLTDTSYKLFAADPTPGHDPKKLIFPPSKSMSALGDVIPREYLPEKDRQEEQKQVAQPKEKSADTDGGSAGGDHKKEVIRGPWRILRLLPRETRHVIGRMLEIDPKKRIQMEEILDDPWVADTPICRQIEPGRVENVETHTHVLEPPAPATKQ